MRYPNTIELELCGRYALFTDPLTKSGGEKCSYPVPTYEALRGILCSVYSSPDITWVIDCVRIMTPIRTESMTVTTRRYFRTGRDISVYTYLRDVKWRVRAHFVPRDGREFTAADEHKHYRIALRSLSRGGRRQAYLGTRDCPCDVSAHTFTEGLGHYDNTDMDFGLMFRSFSYGEDGLPITASYFRCRMEDGVINFPPEQDCPHRRLEPRHAVV